MKNWLRTHPNTVLRGLFAMVFVLMVVGGVYVFREIHGLSLRSGQQGTVISKLASSLDNSRSQLQNHGIDPGEPPASQIIKEVPGAPGAQGPQGNPGAPGASVTGAPGPSGAPGKDGSAGPQGPPGKDGVSATGAPGPQGVPGVNGKDGATGAPGVPGKDGADGAPGATGPQGPPGPAGPQGAQGATPGTYTFQWSDGTVFTCTRSGDASSSSYTCVQQGSATPPPTPPATPADAHSTGPNVGRTSNTGGSGSNGIPVATGMLYAVVHERKYTFT